MNNANIGSASNVIGNPVNLIMSNATEEQLKKYDGSLGLPAHSLIIVNPLNNSKNDSTWNDICITDGNNGIKHIIPFTSIDKSQMYVETSDSGERTLHTNFPATSIDDVAFTCNNGVLSLKNLENLKNLDEEIKKFNSDVDAKISSAYTAIDNYNDVAKKYNTLIDSIKSLADQDDIVTQIQNKTNAIKNTIDGINSYTINNDIQSKITDVNNNIDELTSKQDIITDQVNKINKLIADFIPDSNEGNEGSGGNEGEGSGGNEGEGSGGNEGEGGEGSGGNTGNENKSKILKDIADIIQKTNDSLTQSKAEYEQYKNIIDNLIDNTKDELHREYKALKNSLNDCVNNNLLPLVESQVDTCLANDKLAEIFDGAIGNILNGQDTEAEAGILNSVSRALNGDGNAKTVSEASTNLNSALNTKIKDGAAVAIADFSENVSKAITPKYVDKRYFEVIQLKEVDSEAPDTEKNNVVITLSKPLRDFFKDEEKLKGAFDKLHGSIQF